MRMEATMIIALEFVEPYPWLGTISFSFVDDPTLRFEVEVMNANLTDIPVRKPPVLALAFCTPLPILDHPHILPPLMRQREALIAASFVFRVCNPGLGTRSETPWFIRTISRSHCTHGMARSPLLQPQPHTPSPSPKALAATSPSQGTAAAKMLFREVEVKDRGRGGLIVQGRAACTLLRSNHCFHHCGILACYAILIIFTSGAPMCRYTVYESLMLVSD